MPGIISEAPFASPQPGLQITRASQGHTVFWANGVPEAGGGAYNNRDGLTPFRASVRPTPMLIC